MATAAQKITAAQATYNAAKAKGDTAGMAAAHAAADAARGSATTTATAIDSKGKQSYTQTPIVAAKPAATTPADVKPVVAAVKPAVVTKSTPAAVVTNYKATPAAVTAPKTVADYQADYVKANASGDYAAMRAANDGANALRKAAGTAVVNSASGDAQRAASVVTGTSSAKDAAAWVGPDAKTATKSIADYQSDYQTAYANNDYDGMRAANAGANALRKAQGIAAVDSSAGDAQRQAALLKASLTAPVEEVPTEVDIPTEIEDTTAALQDAGADTIDASTASTIADLKAQLAAAQTTASTAADTSQIDEYTALDNAALRSAKLGDNGGIGQKQYSEAANAGDQRLLEIGLEQKTLEASISSQITAAKAAGETQKATLIAELGQKQLDALTAEQTRLEAQKRDDAQTEATLLGTYKGQPTVETQNTIYTKALNRLQLGLFSEADAVTLGVSSDQAKAFTTQVNLLAQTDLAAAKAKITSALATASKTSSSGKAAAASKMSYGQMAAAVAASSDPVATFNELNQSQSLTSTNYAALMKIANKAAAGVKSSKAAYNSALASAKAIINVAKGRSGGYSQSSVSKSVRTYLDQLIDKGTITAAQGDSLVTSLGV